MHRVDQVSTRAAQPPWMMPLAEDPVEGSGTTVRRLRVYIEPNSRQERLIKVIPSQLIAMQLSYNAGPHAIADDERPIGWNLASRHTYGSSEAGPKNPLELAAIVHDGAQR